MIFHAEFTYRSDEREKLFQFLQSGGLASESNLNLKGAWIAVQTGVGYALIEASDVKPLYDLCARWSEFGEVKITPLISVKDS